jgi:spectinomycin phosphotransferase
MASKPTSARRLGGCDKTVSAQDADPAGIALVSGLPLREPVSAIETRSLRRSVRASLRGVIDYLAADFDIHCDSVEPLGGGVDRLAQNFRGRAGSRAFAIKWSTGGTTAGLVVPGAMADRGVNGVAAPVHTRDGRLWSERDGRRLSVVPWVGERRAIDGGMDAAQWRAFGSVLAATHAMPITPELAAVLPVAGHERDVAQARVTDKLLRSTEPVDTLAVTARRIWLERADRIRAVTSRVGALAPGVTRTTLCHTDAHLGNVLVGPGRVWLIDWDDAALSTREQDLMFVLGGTYGDEHIGDDERAWFFEGYGKVSVDPDLLAYWRGARGLCDAAFLAKEAFTPGDYGDEWRAEAVRLLAASLGPDGIIALALA